MHAAIMEWIQAVLAANSLRNAQEKVQRLTQGNQEQVAKFDDLLTKARAFKATPTWKTYVPVYEGLGIFGHPGTRWSAKSFQKLTPEKKAELQASADKLCAHVESEVAQHTSHYRAELENAERALGETQRYVRPSVEPVEEGKTITRSFPVDLTGWSMSSGLARTLEKTISEDKDRHQKILEKLSPKAKLDTEFTKIIESVAEKGSFSEIRVDLKADPGGRWVGMWEHVSKRLSVVVPAHAGPDQAESISTTLAHELRHFLQSYLEYGLDQQRYELDKDPTRVRPGFPSRKIRTPEFKQWMSPDHPNSRGVDPEVYRKLKDRGIDPKRLDWHSLDDVEFYTKLPDSIDDFRKLWAQYGSPEILNHAIRRWTGAQHLPPRGYAIDTEALGGDVVMRYFSPDRFFVTLRKHAPGKWRKAVSEFVKAVT